MWEEQFCNPTVIRARQNLMEFIGAFASHLAQSFSHLPLGQNKKPAPERWPYLVHCSLLTAGLLFLNIHKLSELKINATLT
jgi:hypothetical protein